MATDKGPWSTAARAKRAATMEAKKKGLGKVVSVPRGETPKKPKKYKKRNKVIAAKAGYDKATIRACIDRLMEML